MYHEKNCRTMARRLPRQNRVARLSLSVEAFSRGACRGHCAISFTTGGAVFSLVPMSFGVSNMKSVEDVQPLHLHREHVRALHRGSCGGGAGGRENTNARVISHRRKAVLPCQVLPLIPPVLPSLLLQWDGYRIRELAQPSSCILCRVM